MFSQNGWPIVDTTKLENLPIPGTNVRAVPGLLKGDVAWLLRWIGGQFNKRVDPLITPGCWGWAPVTPIPGSTIYSNHGSGTAIDLNAPHFPWKLKTMSPRQREECRKIVNQTEGVVVWGGDFTTIVDEMHFEVSGTPQDVARIVEKLKGEDVETIDLFTARRLAYGVLGDKTALTGKRDADLKKNHVGKKLTKKYIETLSDSKEAVAARARDAKLVQPGEAEKQLSAARAAVGTLQNIIGVK